MLCPKCGSSRIFRDSYKGNHEWLRFTPFRPYGCRECLYRFVSWRRKGALTAAMRQKLLRFLLVFSAACPNCRSREVVRINPRTLRGTVRRALARALGFPAYQCRKCGKKFFKFRWHVKYAPPLQSNT